MRIFSLKPLRMRLRKKLRLRHLLRRPHRLLQQRLHPQRHLHLHRHPLQWRKLRPHLHLLCPTAV